MKLLVCGSRNLKWPFQKFLYELDHFMQDHSDTSSWTIIEGGALGVDTWARIAGSQLGAEVLEFPANWKEHSRSAGPVRNQTMLDEGKPDLVLAFWDGRSSGTADMIRRAVQAGVDTHIIPLEERTL